MLNLALDWDEHQLRLVAAETVGGKTTVKVATTRDIQESGVTSVLRKLVKEHGLEKARTLVAIGRDSAELRQMTLPPVDDQELPDMVRFQAIQSFASAGDRAAVDFLPTTRDDSGVNAIVAASGPAKLDPIRKTIEEAGLSLARIALRPVAAAALYQISRQNNVGQTDKSASSHGALALVDLVGDEAEIVLFRGRDLVFVRSVRLPAAMPARVAALAGEIRRSRMACGAADSHCDFAMWGTEARHSDELAAITQRLSADQDDPVESRLIDPFDLVQCDPGVREQAGEQVGRLAPLVGLLVADASHGHRLIDFANPRRKVDPPSNTRKYAIIGAVAAACVLAVVYSLWSTLANLDTQIARQESANKEMRDKVKVSDVFLEQTDRIDQFLDGDVLWLEELERLATQMPPSDQLIVKEVSAVADTRQGGGRLIVSGLVTDPDVIDAMESSLRDESHRVIGDKVTQLETADSYRWKVTETIAVDASAVREQRYARIREVGQEPAEQAESGDSTESADVIEEAPTEDTKISNTEVSA